MLWCQLLWAVLQQDLSSSHPLVHLNMQTADKRALLGILLDAILDVHIGLSSCWKSDISGTHRIHRIHASRHGPSFATTSSATAMKWRTHTD